jgi:hypothetical protein
MMKRLGQNLSSGGNLGLLVFLLWGSLVLVGLFLSVHSRDIVEPQNALQGRWTNVILLWEKEGYFDHGGLWFSKSLSEEPTQTVISPFNMGFLQGAHLLERIHLWFKGSFSFGLLAFHNQLIPMLSSALLGFLAMRLTLRLGIRPVHAFILGLSAQTMYQTFPANLWFFWEIYPTTVGVFFMACFLICETSTEGLEAKSKFVQRMRSFSVFCMVFVEWIGALGFLSVYFLVSRYFALEKKKFKVKVSKIVIPALLAFVVMAGQLSWVKFNYPDVVLMGEGAGSQLGLNQSFLQVEDLATELKKRYESLLPDWNILAAAGFLAVFIVVILIRMEKKEFDQLIILTAGICFYALLLLFNPKSFLLAEAYMVYLAFTLILVFFALLPGWLETFNKNSGIFVLTFFVLAFCWSCIQLRNYSLFYPV